MSVKFPSTKCQQASLMISQHWFSWWLGAIRQQAITWTNVGPDLCGHMALQGHNETILSYSSSISGYHICIMCILASTPTCSASNSLEPYSQEHVTRLGWPRSVYKSNVECRFLSRNGQITLKVKANDLHFSNTSWENTKMHVWCKFGDSSSNQLKGNA